MVQFFKQLYKGLAGVGLICLLLVGLRADAAIKTTPLRDSVAKVYQSFVGVTEANGRNDGPQVEAFQRTTGNRKGDPWCASYVASVLKIARIRHWVNGNGAARSWFKSQHLVWDRATNGLHKFEKLAAWRANTGALYYQHLGRIGHIFFIHDVRGEWVITNEGNTNNGQSREGDGVYSLRRRIRNIYQVSDHVRE